MPLHIDGELWLADECLELRFSRSGGPGGQNVNKVHSRVELLVRLEDVPIAVAARERLRAAAGRRCSAQGVLTVASQRSRDQAANRSDCMERLAAMIRAAIPEPLPRHKTRPTAASRQRRLDTKKREAKTKRQRRANPEDH